MGLTYRKNLGRPLTSDEIDANFEFFTSSLGGATTGSNTFVGNQIITGSILISGSIIPAVGVGQTTSSFDLGSETAAWKDIYVSEGSIKFVKSGSEAVVLSAKDGGIQVNGGPTISADGINGQFFTSKSLDTDITVKDSNNSLLMGPIDVEEDKEIVVEEDSDLTIFGDIEATIPNDLSIRSLNVNSNTSLNGNLTVLSDIDSSGKVNSLFYTTDKTITSDIVINDNESALIIGETVSIEEDKELTIEDESDLTIFGDIETQIPTTVDNALFATTASYASNASYADTSSYTTSASFAATASYALNANTTSAFPYSGSAVITGSLLVNDGTNNVVDTSNYSLYDSNNKISLNWNERRIYSSDEAKSVAAEDRILHDSNNATSLDWENRTLNYPNNNIAVDYNTNGSVLISGNTVSITGSVVSMSGDFNITNPNTSSEASGSISAGGSTFTIGKNSTFRNDSLGTLNIAGGTVIVSGNLTLASDGGLYGLASASSTITNGVPLTQGSAHIAFAQTGSNYNMYVYIGGRWRSASLF